MLGSCGSTGTARAPAGGSANTAVCSSKLVAPASLGQGRGRGRAEVRAYRRNPSRTRVAQVDDAESGYAGSGGGVVDRQAVDQGSYDYTYDQQYDYGSNGEQYDYSSDQHAYTNGQEYDYSSANGQYDQTYNAAAGYDEQVAYGAADGSYDPAANGQGYDYGDQQYSEYDYGASADPEANYEDELEALRAENERLRLLAERSAANLHPMDRAALAAEFSDLYYQAQTVGQEVAIPAPLLEELQQSSGVSVDGMEYDEASGYYYDEQTQQYYDEYGNHIPSDGADTFATDQQYEEQAVYADEEAEAQPFSSQLNQYTPPPLPPAPTAAPRGPPVAPVAAAAAAAAGAGAAAGKSMSRIEKAQAIARALEETASIAKSTRVGRQGAGAAAPAPAASASPVKSQAPAMTDAMYQQIRIAAADEVGEMDPKAVVVGKGTWLVTTVPEKPVAGEECVVYFNRQQSEALKTRPRLLWHGAANDWELESASGPVVELTPAPCNKSQDEDWWWCRLKVPEEAFELKFVISDGDGAYDNNNGQDFWLPVAGLMTKQKWATVSKDRAAALERQRIAEEKRKIEEAQAEESFSRAETDLEKAKIRVDDMKRNQHWMREGAQVRHNVGEGDKERTLWVMAPEVIRPGSKFLLLYNSKVGPLQHIQYNDKDTPVFKIGHNNWVDPIEYPAKRLMGKIKVKRKERYLRKVVETVPDTKAIAEKEKADQEKADKEKAEEAEQEKKEAEEKDKDAATKAKDETADDKDKEVKAKDSKDEEEKAKEKEEEEKKSKETRTEIVAKSQELVLEKKVVREEVVEVIVEKEEDGEWWEAEITVPNDAVALNFVVRYHATWDNNFGKDFKIAVQPPKKFKSFDEWADSFLEVYAEEERRVRQQKEAEELARRKKRMAKHSKNNEHALAVRKRQMKHVLFTKPDNPMPGDTIEVYYNPQNTVLAGKDNVYLRGGFNRWKHPKPFGPIQMIPPETGEHFRAKIQVPTDACMIDFVFSDVLEGPGTYDNRGGLDYHIPVENKTTKLDPLHIVHISVEMAPICKVGGLGDVVTSLGRACKDMGNLVEVIVPRYSFFGASPLLQSTTLEAEFDWGGTRIFVTSAVVEGLRCFFIEPKNGFFDGDYVYGGRGDDVRFDFFCRAALEFLLQTNRQPDILHCHDWSTATVAKAYWDEYKNYGLTKSAVVFTIHNMNYGQLKIGEAAFYSQRFTTVSPTYAFEIGSHTAIEPHAAKFMGIRNGIDMEIWDPETDQFLPRHYSVDNMEEGKAAAREELRNRMNLTKFGDKPIVAVVSRLTRQKGIHLIKHAAYRTVERGAQFMLLGAAPDPKVQGEFDELSSAMTGENAKFLFAFDEPLSHLIYAAADIVLVPSMFEPCGLTQLIAMRYGGVPVVRSTGGLHDTVFDVDYDKPRAAWEMEGSVDWKTDYIDATNGFAFDGVDDAALDYALNRALDCWYNDKKWFRSLQRRVMQQDWSWSSPGIQYTELYHAAIKDVTGF